MTLRTTGQTEGQWRPGLHPGPQQAEAPHLRNRKLYEEHYCIENAVPHLQEGRGPGTRYTRSGGLISSAIALAAVVIFWH